MKSEAQDIAAAAKVVRIVGGGQSYLHLCVPRRMMLSEIEGAVERKVPSTAAGWLFRRGSPAPCPNHAGRFHCVVDAQS